MGSKLFGISMITITCLYGLLAAIIIPIVILAGGSALIAILVAIAILILQFLISPWITDLTMKWFYKAKFGAEIPEYLKNFIDEECKKHNVINPRIAVIDDGAPNAFTYGRTKKSARIVITRGILELLNEEEVKAVVGHEIGHIVHLDMLFMTFAQVVPLVLYAIYEICMRADSNSSSNDSGNYTVVAAVVAYILYVISQYIVLWLSRTREYYADAFAVEETGNPNALAEALVKIGFGLSTTQSKEDKKGKPVKNRVAGQNALGIFDGKASKSMAVSSFDESGHVSKEKIKHAMKWEMWNPWAKWFEIHSTHPLISKRINAISKLAEKNNEEPYIVFDLEKPESYVDDFLVEVVINFMPIISFITAAVLGFVFKEHMFKIFGIGLIITTLLSYIKFTRRHKKGYKETTVSDLLSEVKVSNVTAIPCQLEGTVIGKGNPGCIFSEDFVIKDETGIIFLDYNQPLFIINKVFALFKSEQYFDKVIKVKGWYRRAPVPYVEIYEYEIDGKTKKIFTYGLSKVLYALFAVGGVALTALSFAGMITLHIG